MAYIERRKYKTKTSYLVMVRRKGFKTMVKTFDTRTDAKKWARAVERKLDTGDTLLWFLFCRLLDQYIIKCSGHY